MTAAVGMVLAGGTYPLVSSAAAAVWLLAVVNVFAAMPWGAASAAVADVLPPHLRGQGTALYLLVVNLLAGVLGPTSVALLTDTVFRNPSSLRYSLAICTVCGMAVVIAIFGAGRSAYRNTVATQQPT